MPFFLLSQCDVISTFIFIAFDGPDCTKLNWISDPKVLKANGQKELNSAPARPVTLGFRAKTALSATSVATAPVVANLNVWRASVTATQLLATPTI